MNGNGNHSSEWKAILDTKAHILYSQIAHLQSELAALGSTVDEIEMLCEPYYELLESLYSEDYPLATAIETSDLVVRLQGIGVDKDRPRLSLITSYFDKVRKQVTSIAKAIANLEEGGRRIPKQFDLTLSAFAKGSLVLGFSLPKLQDLEEDGQATLFGENDPLYLAAREAMRTLGVVSHSVVQNAPMEELAAAVPDAKVRDIALSAVKDLAPSGRQGISSVSIAGKEIGELEEGRLTKELRSSVQKVLEHPVEADEIAMFHGHIREIDLDARRFELRHVEQHESNEVRCVYGESYSDSIASKWLNKYVTVSGIVERDANGKARLMEIQSIEVNTPSS
jgi:hypothetical protein